MTLVKVCGLTRSEDVREAVRLHVWACGFVLTSSPRQISPEQARHLRGEAGRSLTVAVVGDEPADEIAEMLKVSGLEAVQLSAGAQGCTVGELLQAVSAAGAGRPLVIAAADTPDAGGADFMLFDSRDGTVYGGTGRRVDWASLRGGQNRPRGRCLLALAGGLDPDNVGEAIGVVRPHVVDVSSGVESAAGIKDRGRLERFMAAVRAADDEVERRRAEARRRQRGRREQSSCPSSGQRSLSANSVDSSARSEGLQ